MQLINSNTVDEVFYSAYRKFFFALCYEEHWIMWMFTCFWLNDVEIYPGPNSLNQMF